MLYLRYIFEAELCSCVLPGTVWENFRLNTTQIWGPADEDVCLLPNNEWI